MEAIQPGSSTAVRSFNAYETVSPVTKDDTSSYASHETHDIQPPESSTAVIYDEPSTIDSDRAQVQELSCTESEADPEYDEPILMSPMTMVTSSSTQLQPQPQALQSSKDEDGDSRVYSNIPDDLIQNQEEPYVEVAKKDLLPPIDPSSPTLEDISMENLDPKEAQLWLLLQMQKMVQKMEDVYDTFQPLSARSAKRHTTKFNSVKSHDKTNTPPPPSTPNPPSEAAKETDREAEPTHQELYTYMNPDTINEAITESPPPPIPPRTYQVVDRNQADSEASSESRPASSASKSDRGYIKQQQSNTLPSQPVAGPKPSTMQAQDTRVHQHQIEASAGKKTK